MTIITDARCVEYSKPGHPERPQRVAKTVERLKSQTELPLQWADPLPVDDEIILRAHTPEHLQRLKKGGADFDGDTPAHPGIHEHARRSVGGALAALREARQGRMAFSLLRPPGHHATRERMMGFCYLNSIAISVMEALSGGASRVAVLDFDVHHGNGTEDILMGRPHCAFHSVHQHPAYPGTGIESRGNCHNFPVPPGSTSAVYRDACSHAMDRIRQFKPDLIAVSAGFDAYKRDPLADQNMEAGDFLWLGQSIRRMGVPTFSLLEGGYSSDLPELILAYLKGLAEG
jgi:acetoin utilization deacetylase AcuC-like enzyme